MQSIKLLYSIGNINFSLQSIYSKINWGSSSFFNKIELTPWGSSSSFNKIELISPEFKIKFLTSSNEVFIPPKL